MKWLTWLDERGNQQQPEQRHRAECQHENQASGPAAPEAASDEDLDRRIEREGGEHGDQNERDRAPGDVDEADDGGREEDDGEHLHDASSGHAHLPLSRQPVPFRLQGHDAPSQVVDDVEIGGWHLSEPRRRAGHG